MDEKERLLKAKIPGDETGIQVKRTICDICCPSFHCGIDAYVKDGQVIKIEGTADHPVNHGLLCPKGLSNRQYIYREDRLQTPLRRMGPRGSGQFEPISWEEAYREIAQRLNAIKAESGPESVLFYSGYTKWYRPFLHRFTYSFGSPNFLTESSSCMTSTFLNWWVTTGNPMCSSDVARAGVFLGWAYNPYYSRHLAALNVEKRKAEGMKVIIIDPRITPASLKLADIHLRPRTGTDGALALGLAHILIREDRIDRNYIDRYVYGFEAYADYVKQFTPERVEELTGVPAEQLEAAARMIWENLPVAINESAAPLAHHRNGFQNYRAIMSLSAILGCFDRPGGQIPIQFSYNYLPGGFPTREDAFIMEHYDRVKAPAVGAERFPIWNDFIHEAQANDLSRQIEEGSPYPIRAMMGFGMNYRISPDDTRLKKNLMKLDFLVNTELFMTDTCKFCDIVLPACTSFERSELKSYGGGYLYLTKPVIPPRFQSRSDIQILCELAQAMDLDDELLRQGPEACWAYILQDLPVSIEELKEAEGLVKVPGVTPYVPGTMLERGLNTASGKFELYSLAIEKHPGFDPLPTYRPPYEDRPDEDLPMVLSSSPRLPNVLHSRLHKVPWNRSLRPEPTADLHPEDGARLGIAQGDRIEITSHRGSIQVKANLTLKAEPGVVCFYHGYAEADANELTDNEILDPYSGFPSYRETRVSIRKV